MRRRSLLGSLAAGAAGLAGCTTLGRDGEPIAGNDSPADGSSGPPPDGAGGNRGGSDDADGPDDRDDPDQPAPAERPPESYASVVELETGPRTYAFAPTSIHTDDGTGIALWFDRTATADHPARLTGWIENPQDYAITLRVERLAGVGRIHSRTPSGHDHTARLHLAPAEGNALAETVPDVVRDESGYWRVADVGPWMPETYRLEPGERVGLAYVVVGEPDTPGRPATTYEFRGRDETVTVTAWNTASPGPDTESRFAGRSVPDLGREATVQWYHEADESTVAYLQPDRERIELDGVATFEVVNNSHEGLRCGHWHLHKLVDGEWFRVGPRVHTADCRLLHAGDRKRWTLRAFNGEAVPCGPDGCDGLGFTRGFLGGGQYAVVVGYGHPADRSAALVELVGDPVELTLTDDAEVARDGATVTVTTGAWDDGERPPNQALALTRSESADERLLAEQVTGSSGHPGDDGALRNALAATAETVDRVVVRTDEYGVDAALGHDADARRFRFRGQAYEAARVGSEE